MSDEKRKFSVNKSHHASKSQHYMQNMALTLGNTNPLGYTRILFIGLTCGGGYGGYISVFLSWFRFILLYVVGAYCNTPQPPNLFIHARTPPQMVLHSLVGFVIFENCDPLK